MNEKLEKFIIELADLMKKHNAEITETGIWDVEGLTIGVLDDNENWHSIDSIDSNLNCEILNKLIVSKTL